MTTDKTRADTVIAGPGSDGELKTLAEVVVKLVDGKVIVRITSPQRNYKAAPKEIVREWTVRELLTSLEDR
jgi:hypothetical protein